MATAKRAVTSDQPPQDMATPLYSLWEMGQIIAETHDLEDGLYEVVLEFKLGPAQLQLSKEQRIGAMGVTFGGIGLRPATDANPMTIEVQRGRRAAARKSATKSAPRKSAAKKASQPSD